MTVAFEASFGVFAISARTSLQTPRKAPIVQPSDQSSLLGQRGLPKDVAGHLGREHLARTRGDIFALLSAEANWPGHFFDHIA